MMYTHNQPRYVISVAAEMLGTQPYTLRYYEKVGIVQPARSSGNIRLYSDDDLETIKKAMTLMNDMGVNLAGVEVILHVTRQLSDMQDKMNEMEIEMERLRKEAGL
jgi:MerR family transcriptional regulator/heat shock protein HspR